MRNASLIGAAVSFALLLWAFLMVLGIMSQCGLPR